MAVFSSSSWVRWLFVSIIRSLILRNSSSRDWISASLSASSLLARSKREFSSALRIRSCSIIVSKLLILDLMVALSFNVSIICFLSSSIRVFNSSILCCTCVKEFLASFLDCSREAISSSYTALSARSLDFSCSFSWICSLMVLARSWKCCSFPCAFLICSFKTAISPSSLPRVTFASDMEVLAISISWSSSSIRSWILSYSFLILSYCCTACSYSPLAIAYFSSTSVNCPFILSFSKRNRLTSSSFNSSRFFKKIFAFSDCFSNGPTCFSSSLRISLTRTRFCFSSSSFFCAVALRFLNFTIPAASSNSSLFSSGLPLRIFSIWPWPMIEYPSLPIPVS